MEANAARMKEILGKNAGGAGADKDDLMQFAHNLVYGGAQKRTVPNKAGTEQEDQEDDPAYEPDAADLANAADDLIDEEETTPPKTTSKVTKSRLLTFPTPFYSGHSNDIMYYGCRDWMLLPELLTRSEPKQTYLPQTLQQDQEQLLKKPPKQKQGQRTNMITMNDSP